MKAAMLLLSSQLTSIDPDNGNPDNVFGLLLQRDNHIARATRLLTTTKLVTTLNIIANLFIYNLPKKIPHSRQTEED